MLYLFRFEGFASAAPRLALCVILPPWQSVRSSTLSLVNQRAFQQLFNSS